MDTVPGDIDNKGYGIGYAVMTVPVVVQTWVGWVVPAEKEKGDRIAYCHPAISVIVLDID
jgi:hypothetical protein